MWATANYEGLQATGDPSLYRVAMFEIIRGINERLAALGTPGSGAVYKKSDGTLSQIITMEDLAGIHMPGNASYLKYNMGTIHQAIRALATKFTISSGRSSVYTGTSIMDAVGLPYAQPQAGDKWTDFRWWQGWQDALDLLVYGWVRSPSATQALTSKLGTQQFTRDLAWQRCNDAAELITPPPGSPLSSSGYGYEYPFGSTFGPVWYMGVPWRYQAGQRRIATVSVTPPPGGTLNEAWLDGGPSDSAKFKYAGYYEAPLEFLFNSATDLFTLTSTIPNDPAPPPIFAVPLEENYTKRLVNADFPLGATSEFSIEILNAPPVMSPITGGIASTGAGWAGFSSHITFYIDFSPVLTDQI